MFLTILRPGGLELMNIFKNCKLIMKKEPKKNEDKNSKTCSASWLNILLMNFEPHSNFYINFAPFCKCVVLKHNAATAIYFIFKIRGSRKYFYNLWAYFIWCRMSPKEGFSLHYLNFLSGVSELLYMYFFSVMFTNVKCFCLF